LRGIAVRKNGVASLAYGDEAIQLRAGRRAYRNVLNSSRTALFVLARFARAGLLRRFAPRNDGFVSRSFTLVFGLRARCARRLAREPNGERGDLSIHQAESMMFG
jgi:hypothetical protein